MTSETSQADGQAGSQPEPGAPPVLSSRRRLAELIILGALSAFGPLSMDMYLPATPSMATDLHATQPMVQLTMSGCLAGLAIGQFIAGPLSDGHGRRRPLMIGLAAFTALSVACAIAPDVVTLIILRFLQGAAGATGVVLSLAMVRDMYEGKELARVLGSLTLVFGLAPVLAPVLGGQILRFTDWRGIFGALAALGLVLGALSWFLAETLPAARRAPPRFRRLLADLRTLLRDRQYTGNTAAVAFGTAALITYISTLPFIVEDGYGKSPQLFSLFFMINSIGLVLMAQLGTRLVKKRKVETLVVVPLIVMVAAAVALLVAALTAHPPLIALLVPLFVFVAAFGMMRPNGTALAMADQGAIAGTASAFHGALPFLFGAFLAPLAGLGGLGNPVPTAIAIGALSVVAFVLQRALTGRPGDGLAAPRARRREALAERGSAGGSQRPVLPLAPVLVEPDNASQMVVPGPLDQAGDMRGLVPASLNRGLADHDRRLGMRPDLAERRGEHRVEVHALAAEAVIAIDPDHDAGHYVVRDRASARVADVDGIHPGDVAGAGELSHDVLPRGLVLRWRRPGPAPLIPGAVGLGSEREHHRVPVVADLAGQAAQVGVVLAGRDIRHAHGRHHLEHRLGAMLGGQLAELGGERLVLPDVVKGVANRLAGVLAEPLHGRP
jgi:DHA1 family bicyclomycin/chloramphenicol resistance-like MFS transporter